MWSRVAARLTCNSSVTARKQRGRRWSIAARYLVGIGTAQEVLDGQCHRRMKSRHRALAARRHVAWAASLLSQWPGEPVAAEQATQHGGRCIRCFRVEKR